MLLQRIAVALVGLLETDSRFEETLKACRGTQFSVTIIMSITEGINHFVDSRCDTTQWKSKFYG